MFSQNQTKKKRITNVVECLIIYRVFLRLKSKINRRKKRKKCEKTFHPIKNASQITSPKQKTCGKVLKDPNILLIGRHGDVLSHQRVSTVIIRICMQQLHKLGTLCTFKRNQEPFMRVFFGHFHRYFK